MKKEIEILKTLVTELFELIGTKSKFEVSYNKEQEAFEIDVDAGEETGLLIGRKGDNLLSIQTILGLMYKNNTGEWVRVVVNVGDYKEKEEEYLKGLAQSASARAKETGEPQSLYNLKPAQRRIVHMFLSEDSTITTESTGEDATDT
jgi:spoIIIJ-associated protein